MGIGIDPQTVGYKAKAYEARNLVYFFAIVFGLQALRYGLLITHMIKMPSGEGLSALSAGPGIILITLASWAPLIAAFVVTAIRQGKSGCKALWGRFWNHNLSLKWLLVTLLTLPFIHIAGNLLSRARDGIAYPFFALPDPPWKVLLTFLYAFFANGILEEFGWRGFVLPRFQAKWNALTSSVILGVIWASWHLGQWFVPDNPRTQNIWAFTIIIVMESILMTWIFNHTKGSVLAAALFHGMLNTSLIWCCGLSAWYYPLVLTAAALLVIIFFGPKNLVRKRAGVALKSGSAQPETELQTGS
jgi:uncharacterized protein